MERNEPVRLLLVRPASGGLTRRQVHVVVLDAEQVDESATLTTVCGQTYAPGEVEQLNAPTGMPCTLCLAYSPPPVEQRPLEDFPSLRRLRR